MHKNKTISSIIFNNCIFDSLMEFHFKMWELCDTNFCDWVTGQGDILVIDCDWGTGQEDNTDNWSRITGLLGYLKGKSSVPFT